MQLRRWIGSSPPLLKRYLIPCTAAAGYSIGMDTPIAGFAAPDVRQGSALPSEPYSNLGLCPRCGLWP